MKLKMAIVLFLLTFIFDSLVKADTSDSSKVALLMEKVTRYQKKHLKIQGDFTLIVNNNAQEGIFFYNNGVKNNSVKLFFGPTEALGTSDEKKYSYWLVQANRLWVFLASQKVLVEQEIPDYFMAIGNLGGGLSHYFSDYKKFSVAQVMDGKDKVNKITFTEPIKDVAFTSVTLEITDDGFQEATYATTITITGKVKKENQFTFKLSNVNGNASFDPKKEFRVNPSGDVQILRNVLLKN